MGSAHWSGTEGTGSCSSCYNGLLPPHGRMGVNESCHVHASMFLIPFNYCTEALVEQDQYIVLWCFSFGSDWL